MARDKFLLTSVFRGYVNKRDVTNIPESESVGLSTRNVIHLVDGSQNVLSTDGETLKVRNGYTRDGAANTTISPILSSFDWDTSTGVERNLRSYQDNLEVRFVNGTTITWETLGTSGNSTYDFASWWSATELIDLLLLVNGQNYILEWSGGQTTFSSATSNSITKQGTTTWAANRFLTAGTRQIRVKDDSGTWRIFTYTGGETTTTLTGVTPDPTTFTISAGNLVMQELRSNTSQPGSATKNNWIKVLNNQVYIGSKTSQILYISSNTSFTSYTSSTPRVPGEGAQSTLDSFCSGLAPVDDAMFVSVGTHSWFKVVFTLSPGSTTDRETVTIKKLKTGPRQAAKDGDLIANAKNKVIFVSNEPTLDELGNVENLQTPQSLPISDPIKVDFDNLDFTNGHVKYYKSNIYIALPVEGKVLIYNVLKQFWEAPQILPIRRFAIIGGILYGHSSQVPETYKLFDGTNDNSNSIAAKVVFQYQNFGSRSDLKNFDEFYSEGYITPSTTDLKLTLKYDFDGATQIIEQIIPGDDTEIAPDLTPNPSLGEDELGAGSLGGEAASTTVLVKSKFRIFHTLPSEDFYELQVSYETDAIDRYWEILAFGPAVRFSTSQSVNIKRP